VQVDDELCPVKEEKVPEGHRTGATPAGQYMPAGQGALLFCSNLVPAGQKTPALHATGPRFATQNEPAGQTIVFVFEPGGQEIPAGQLVHTAILTAPAIIPKEPPGQGRHTPPLDPYVPGKHGTPAVPAGLHVNPAGSPLQRVGGVTRPLNSNEGAVNV